MKNSLTEQDILFPVDFRSMSQSELKELGMGDIAYVRQLIVNGRPAFVLHAADGTALAVQGSAPAVEQNAYDQDLGLVTLH